MMDPKRKAAVEIVQILKRAGHRALFAGGCVRDFLRGEHPKDWDIATGALPEEIRALFPKTVAIGMKFGVVLVLHGGFQFEVSTFRAEEGFSDGRHPDRVVFTGSPEEDALRRDFTVNGLYLDPDSGEILDWVGGREDLAAGLLSAIGDPDARFSEDYLRMLRAVRFVATLGLTASTETAATIRRLAGKITSISSERIRDELLKILVHPGRRKGMECMVDFGLLDLILPEVDAMRGVDQPPDFHPEGDVFEHTMVMLETVKSPSETLALGILLHDVGKPVTKTVEDRIRFHGHAREGVRLAGAICRRLRLSNAHTDRVISLVGQHMKFIEIRRMRPSTLKRFLRMEGFDEHLELHRLDCLASHGNLGNWEYAGRNLEKFGEEGLRPPRLISGRDLMDMHIPRGPLYKRILEGVEEEQLSGRVANREKALELARELWEEEKNRKE